MRDKILEDFTTTFHNFGRAKKITKWKSDKVIDKLIYKKLKKSEKKPWLVLHFIVIFSRNEEWKGKNERIKKL